MQLSVLFDTDKESGVQIPKGDPRRLLAIAVFHYVEMVLWFAFYYRIFVAEFRAENAFLLDTIPGALYFSIVTTLGNGDIGPKSDCAAWLVTVNLIMGIGLTLLVLGRFVGALRNNAES